MTDKYKVYERPEFCIKLERNKQNTIFMHCEVSNWNKTIFKELTYAANSVFTMLALAGCKIVFVGVKTDDKKLKKFVRLFGFVSSKKISDKGIELFFKIPVVGE